jgi:hypothetical protein
VSIALDILRTYRSPREVLRRRTGSSQREDRALAMLMGGCAVMFISQWPRLARESHIDETVGFDARLAGALFGWLLMAPLFFYGLAWISHLVLTLIGKASTGYQARVVLFWALLAAGPLWMLTGLMAGFVGPGLETTVTGLAALAAFVVFWFVGIGDIARSPNESRA